MQFFLEANVLATLTKFMNKDIGTYLQVSRQELDESKTGFVAPEKELDKHTIRFEEDMNEYAIQSTRTITSILRILQKLTKRKPNIIKNALCRGQTIVWLKVRQACCKMGQILFGWHLTFASVYVCIVCIQTACGGSSDPIATPVCVKIGEVAGEVFRSSGSLLCTVM